MVGPCQEFCLLMLQHCSCFLLDIDECYEEIDQCMEYCNNWPGTYNCSCRVGYQVDSDGFNCTGMALHT